VGHAERLSGRLGDGLACGLDPWGRTHGVPVPRNEAS
jgi:hypothetical protein